MIKKDSIIIGMLQGILFPVMFYFIFNEVNELLIEHYFGRPPGVSQRFIFILSIGSNLIPILVANNLKNARTMRGIMNSTLILTAAVIVIFSKELLTD